MSIVRLALFGSVVLALGAGGQKEAAGERELREELIAAARGADDALVRREVLAAEPATVWWIDRRCVWSWRIAEAELGAAAGAEEREQAMEAHLKRILRIRQTYLPSPVAAYHEVAARDGVAVGGDSRPVGGQDVAGARQLAACAREVHDLLVRQAKDVGAVGLDNAEARCTWSRRWAEHECTGAKKEERIKAIQQHMDRLGELEGEAGKE